MRPDFTLLTPAERTQNETAGTLPDEDDAEEEESLFSAAYEGVVYTDSTDDGVDSELFDTGDTTTDELSRESQRITDRVAFLSSLAKLWKLAAVSDVLCAPSHGASEAGPFECLSTMRHWIEQAIDNHRQLLELLDTVRRYRIPMAGTDPDTLMQYDRQRLVKDALLERIAAACVDISSVGQTMLAALASRSHDHDREIEELADAFGDEASMHGSRHRGRVARRQPSDHGVVAGAATDVGRQVAAVRPVVQGGEHPADRCRALSTMPNAGLVGLVAAPRFVAGNMPTHRDSSAHGTQQSGRAGRRDRVR